MASIMHSILGRGPFNGGSTSTEHTCDLSNPLLESPTEPITDNLTFHQIGTIISACAAGFATLSIALLMFRHATHLSRPNEQLKILRICLLIPVNSIIQLIGQLVPQAYFYIVPWADLMQALALGNFFLLLLEFISPHDNQRDFFFSGLQVPAKRSGRAPKNGLRWYRRKWLAIFQYPIVQLLVCVATDVTNSPRFNIYCANSNKPYFGHLWINLVHILATLTAVISCLRFYKILRGELSGHKPLAKLFAFKMLVGLNVLMNVIFWILNGLSNSPLTPDATMSEADAVAGIPAIVNCVILVPFSIFFHYAYDVGPYIIHRGHHSAAEQGHQSQYLQYQGGPLGIRAFTGMLNPSEILGAIAFLFKMRGRSDSGNVTSGRGYDVVTSTDGQQPGYAHELGRRDHRRINKYGGGGGVHSGRYELRDGRGRPNVGYYNNGPNGGTGQPGHVQW